MTVALELHDVALAPWATCNDELPEHLYISAKGRLVTLDGEHMDARKRVEELKEKLAKARAELSATQDELWTTEKQIQIYRNMVAPMRRFPPELLSRVFLFSIPPFHKLPRYGQGDRDKLRLVCKRWKIIVDSSPELWKRLRYTQSAASPQFAVRLLQRWFSHAGNGGLGLTIDLRPMYADGELTTFLRSKTWKELSLYTTSPEILEAVFPKSYNCSALETLCITWAMSGWDAIDRLSKHPLYRHFPTFLQRFSRLKQLSIEWSIPHLTMKPKLFELPDLTDLKLRGAIPHDYVRRLLNGLPSLKNVDISLSVVRGDTSPRDVDDPLPIRWLTTDRGWCWLFKDLPLLEALRPVGSWQSWSPSFSPTSLTSLYRLANLSLVSFDRMELDSTDTALAVSHLPPSVRVVRVSTMGFTYCITRRMAARNFVGRRLDIVVTKSSDYAYVWEGIIRHLMRVFVKKRPGRAREAFRARDLVIWIKVSSWEGRYGYRDEWKDWLDQLRSVNVRFELTLGPHPGDDVEFDIPYM
ncbi:hypothetical protein CC1G_04067 [Coprinopsis cinerea okayama7|uniref:F-box domain-containing protein n=1 Tax=Coprinopsis cinerea (strain Okayama-7 / 130 / ATCC MYA-4618 / FGSC 9003) TaxID=240176 RepID=A8NVU0_COPC7|nr:hypothetical protein CC1G_04067 [Coprinopsis cinerea okayama7\|eukprot:XP_001836754.1 hypothetical protein CC1G_04067 [Coprinopsis cinerea okayama7\